MIKSRIVLTAALVLSALTANAGVVTLTTFDPGSGPVGTHFISRAIDHFGPGGFDALLEPTSLPVATQHIATSGTASSSTRYEFNDQRLRADFSHAVGPRASAHSLGYAYFIPAVDLLYEISGTYELSGWRDLFLWLRLVDIDGAATLFENQQASAQTVNEFFTLGENGGDTTHYAVLSGNMTGQLRAGHPYQLLYLAATLTTEAGDARQSASGFVMLEFARAVPEPSTIALALLGGVALLVTGTRRAKETPQRLADRSQN